MIPLLYMDEIIRYISLALEKLSYKEHTIHQV